MNDPDTPGSRTTDAYDEPLSLLTGASDHAALPDQATDDTGAPILDEPELSSSSRLDELRAEHAERRLGLLWLDEIQTGVGRTGSWFAAAADPDVAPDIVTLAKGLAGGFPIGACLALGEAADLLEPGNHGTTFGGNPVACAAALAVIGTIESDDLLARATVLGQKIRDGLATDPRVVEVRGDGLLIGLTLAAPLSAQVHAAALAAGFILNNPTADRIRIAPPQVRTTPPPPHAADDSDAMRARIGEAGAPPAPKLFNPDGSIRLGDAAPKLPQAPANPQEAAKARWAEIRHAGENPLDCKKTRFAQNFAPDESVGSGIARKYLSWVGLYDPHDTEKRARRAAEGCDPPK